MEKKEISVLRRKVLEKIDNSSDRKQKEKERGGLDLMHESGRWRCLDKCLMIVGMMIDRFRVREVRRDWLEIL